MSNRGHAVRTAMARSHLYIIKTPARKASALRAGVCTFTISYFNSLFSHKSCSRLAFGIYLININRSVIVLKIINIWINCRVVKDIRRRSNDSNTANIVYLAIILANRRELYIVGHSIDIRNSLHICRNSIPSPRIIGITQLCLREYIRSSPSSSRTSTQLWYESNVLIEGRY